MNADFLLTAFVVVLLPGTGVLYTLAVGLGLGARAATIAALGCTLGMLPQLLLATFGLALILQASAASLQIIRLLGTAYLLFIAWQVFRGNGALALDAASGPRSTTQLVGTGLWLNLLNPKLGLFFLAFLPQFVAAGSEDARALFLVLGLVFALMTFVVFIGYGLLAAWVRDYVIGRPAVMRVIRWSFTLAFVVLALRLALETLQA
ncbi:LysE family translocator [Pseudomonas sp. GD04087]|uniref:LysE family translocator n=1 Tax=Pseudomonas TaxID=286 RepID=UPI001F268448|nr:MULTISPECIES: LysE family translocator [Pseudomonas]MCP1651249.1 threonine/homoserine/homoserine lactone efflux protein [Pseudomonas nitroreducens]MCP1684226.1 threonine/homoserine/homoserine lactone efflux protein [Pseudomonas nitroreducens]MDH0292522.1 LysE family translocator [Pseudomonas sp. GD04087]MDH1051159.1 LysE family translocator [Pseudomonas sp. GD03903]MDH1998457.1 LysE family translocator [Pseudomonas sp. GD03691]